MPSRVLALVFCIAAPLAAQDAANDKQELEKLQGDWVQVSATVGGVPTPERALQKVTLKSDQWTLTLAPSGNQISMTFTLDGTKDPKAIDQKTSSGGVRPGIYKVEGEMLTICFASRTAGERPKEFKATETTILQVWKRAGK
jgi:uncharacterized protein (TIGR03067 family)